MSAPAVRRVDTGRIVMVPLAALLLLYDVGVLLHHLPHGGASVLRWVGTVLIGAFYGLMIWCYLRRGPARATGRSVSGHLAAAIATLAPLAVPFLHGAPPGKVQAAAADALLVLGGAWSVWSLRSLGRNLSIIAQAREVVDRGPYRWVRHPLYTGEIASCLGVALTAGTAAAVGAWLVFCGLQAYRAVREEEVLLRALPGYRPYRSRTAALLPGIF